jgi:hypothetical protein
MTAGLLTAMSASPMRAPAAPKQNHRCYASFAQRVHMATVLKQERGCDRGIPCVYVNGGPVLAGIQEDFCQVAVLESANASSVANSAMLKAK